MKKISLWLIIPAGVILIMPLMFSLFMGGAKGMAYGHVILDRLIPVLFAIMGYYAGGDIRKRWMIPLAAFLLLFLESCIVLRGSTVLIFTCMVKSLLWCVLLLLISHKKHTPRTSPELGEVSAVREAAEKALKDVQDTPRDPNELDRKSFSDMLRDGKYLDNVLGPYRGMLISTGYSYDSGRRKRWVLASPDWSEVHDGTDVRIVYSGREKCRYDGESLASQVIEAMDAVDAFFVRKQAKMVSSFEDMIIDMDYPYWKPSIHVRYGDISAVMDYNGIVRGNNGDIIPNSDCPIPQEKMDILIRWISAHKNDIVENHLKCCKGSSKVRPITGLQPAFCPSVRRMEPDIDTPELDRNAYEKILNDDIYIRNISGYYRDAHICSNSSFTSTGETHHAEAVMILETPESHVSMKVYSGEWIGQDKSLAFQVVEAMDAVDAYYIRRQAPAVSSFEGMSLDMDYGFWEPAVHVKYLDMSAVIDSDGNFRSAAGGTEAYCIFPKEKKELLKKWVSIHRDEVISNHIKCSKGDYNVSPIDPISSEDAFSAQNLPVISMEELLNSASFPKGIDLGSDGSVMNCDDRLYSLKIASFGYGLVWNVDYPLPMKEESGLSLLPVGSFMDKTPEEVRNMIYAGSGHFPEDEIRISDGTVGNLIKADQYRYTRLLKNGIFLGGADEGTGNYHNEIRYYVCATEDGYDFKWWIIYPVGEREDGTEHFSIGEFKDRTLDEVEKIITDCSGAAAHYLNNPMANAMLLIAMDRRRCSEFKQHNYQE